MAPSAELSTNLGQNRTGIAFARRSTVYPGLLLADHVLCGHMCISFTSLSVVRAACLFSVYGDADMHRARKYRSGYFFSGVSVCARVPETALIHPDLGCDDTKALSSVFARNLANKK